jgi:hypothetical protein
MNRISANYKTNLKTEFVTSKRQTNPYKPYIAMQEILATFGTKDTRQRQSKQNKKQINTEN